MDLIEYEEQVLRHLAGLPEPDLIHGAAYNEACNSLRGFGLVNRQWQLTNNGREYLAKKERESNSNETETTRPQLEGKSKDLET